MIAERFPHPLARQWIDEELAYAAVLWDPTIEQGGMVWSNLRCSMVGGVEEAWHRMVHAAADRIDEPGLGRMLRESEALQEAVPNGDGPAFRDRAAAAEWRAFMTRDWEQLSDAFLTVGEPAAAEVFLARAYQDLLFPDADLCTVGAARSHRDLLRGRLCRLLAQNATGAS